MCAGHLEDRLRQRVEQDAQERRQHDSQRTLAAPERPRSTAPSDKGALRSIQSRPCAYSGSTTHATDA